jgi:hypothetical protein
MRLQSPGLAPFEIDLRLPLDKEKLRSTIFLSARALNARAVAPDGRPISGLRLIFSRANGGALWQSVELPESDLSGRIYVPLTIGQAGAPLVAAPAADSVQVYPDVRYREVAPEGGARKWEMVFSPRNRATNCDVPRPESPRVRYEEVQAVFTRYCIGCHNNNQPAKDLSLLEGFSFSELFERKSAQMPGRKLLDSRIPAESYLQEKINCVVPSHGYLMPPTSRGLIERRDRQRITDWIHQGMPVQTGLEISLHVGQPEGSSPLKTLLRVGALGGKPPYTVAWDLGDGTSSDAWSLEHVYTSDSGTKIYRGRVKVSDSSGATSKATFEVRAKAPMISKLAAPKAAFDPIRGILHAAAPAVFSRRPVRGGLRSSLTSLLDRFLI